MMEQAEVVSFQESVVFPALKWLFVWLEIPLIWSFCCKLATVGSQRFHHPQTTGYIVLIHKLSIFLKWQLCAGPKVLNRDSSLQDLYIQWFWVHRILTKGQKGDTSRSAKLPNWQSSLESKTCYIWPRILSAFLTIFKVNMVVGLKVVINQTYNFR